MVKQFHSKLRSGKQAPLTVFVSHASQDIAFAQAVRNHLEQNGAKALLFHMTSLRHPMLFWPLIAGEIRARNFFLYCESAAAARSRWVQRERAYVESVADRRPIRIGRVTVPQWDVQAEVLRRHRVAYDIVLPLDVETQLNRFLDSSHVELVCDRRDERRVLRYWKLLVRAGFRVGGLTNLERIDGGKVRMIERDGVVVRFLSKQSVGQIQSAEVNVVLDDCAEAREHISEGATVLVDDRNAPQALLRSLLTRTDGAHTPVEWRPTPANPV